MSNGDDHEFDVFEFAEQLGYTDELGKHDMSDPNIERATTKESRGLSRAERDDRVAGGVEVPGGVAIRARIATADVAADQTLPEVRPPPGPRVRPGEESHVAPGVVGRPVAVV